MIVQAETELTSQQRGLDAVIYTPPEIPSVRVIDPRTKTAYMLVSAEVYQWLQAMWAEELQRQAIATYAVYSAAKRMLEDV